MSPDDDWQDEKETGERKLYPHEVPKRRIAFRPKGESAWCYVSSWDAVDDSIKGGDDGDIYEFKVSSMSDAEFDALGDFDGW